MKKQTLNAALSLPLDNANFPKIINEYRDLVQLNHETWQQHQQQPQQQQHPFEANASGKVYRNIKTHAFEH